jgi:hypothetical protein
MTGTGPPSAVLGPDDLVPKVRRDLHEVRMGVYLASVRLYDGRVVEPVVINARSHFVGRAISRDLSLEAVEFDTDEVADLTDASDWNAW